MLQGTERRPTLPEFSVQGMVPSGAARSIYRLEDIEIDSAQGFVKKGSKEEYLRQQSFHVLLYLLDHHERLVGKEELIEAFWQHTAVTDNALVQCIADIRKALGDDSRHPRFIKTIPKVGYRFIGSVEVERQYVPAASPEKTPGITAEPMASVPAGKLSGGRKVARVWNGMIRRAILAVSVAAVLLVGWLVFFLSSRTRVDVTLPRVPGKKGLAVMYFENQSQKADLNWLREGLADMFIADLAHSDQLNVLSRQQLQMLLAKAGYKSAREVTLDEAFDVAHKIRAQAVMLGSFAVLGEGLLINVQLFEYGTGRLLAADQFTVDRPSDILGQVDLLSLKLAAYLGAAPLERAKKATLADAMTKDFEAYRYYSLGVSKAQNFENSEAVSLLQKAIERDPEFAMAYARIGYAYSVTDFLPEKGKPYLEKAFQLSSRLTEKDRLYVAAWYAIAREDYGTAIGTFRQIIAQYPVEIEAYARLARLLLREERPQEAIKVIQEGLLRDPDAEDLYNVLGICFLGLKSYDDALAAHERYVELAPKEPNAHDSLGMSYQQSGWYAKAMTEYRVALTLNPRFEPAIIHLADVYAQQGRYREAIRQYQRYIDVAQASEARAVAYGSIAQVYRRKSDFPPGEEAARNEMRYAPGAVWNSLLFALDRGDSAEAARLQAGLFENSPYPERGVRHELRSHEYYLGVIALRNKEADEALAHFKQALRHLPPSSGLDLYEDCLGNAYLELGQFDGAIAEYERILRLNPNYPFARYHLAQAWERNGNVKQARDAYGLFLKSWQDADPDIPEIIDAKRKRNGAGVEMKTVQDGRRTAS